RTDTREAAIATEAGGSVAFGGLAFHAAAVQARGSVDAAYRTGLFRHAYGDAYYRGYVDSAGLLSVAFESGAAPLAVAPDAAAPAARRAAPDSAVLAASAPPAAAAPPEASQRPGAAEPPGPPAPLGPDRRLAIGLAIGGGVAGAAAIVAGALAYAAHRDY